MARNGGTAAGNHEAGMLKRLIDKKELSIVGVNSGTSADGIDLALIRFSTRGRTVRVSFVNGEVAAYPAAVRTALERAITSETLSKEEIARLDMAYGTYLGGAVQGFLRAHAAEADLVASHGQTIGHFPRRRKTLKTTTGATLQIGDGNALAAAAGLPAVTDFRRTDIARGGEGAPLTPFVNQLLFGGREGRIIVNIGGIANYSLHPGGGSVSAVRGGDCGPGNTLIDTACRMLLKRPFDLDGNIAAGGTVCPGIVRLIVAANRGGSVSTGRERFGNSLLAHIIHAGRVARAEKEDIIASITEATARLIHRSLKPMLRDETITGIYLTGGGRRNLYLVERLVKLCHPARVWPIEALGYDGDFLEAVSFAVLGGCCLCGIPSTLPGVSGAVAGGIAGKVALPGRAMIKK